MGNGSHSSLKAVNMQKNTLAREQMTERFICFLERFQKLFESTTHSLYPELTIFGGACFWCGGAAKLGFPTFFQEECIDHGFYLRVLIGETGLDPNECRRDLVSRLGLESCSIQPYHVVDWVAQKLDALV